MRNDLRLTDDRPPHRHTLALAAGELLGPAVEQLLEPEQARGLVDALLDLRLRPLGQLQAEGDVLRDGHVRVERVVLEHHRDVTVLLGNVVHAPAADVEVARADVLEPRDHAERGRLATARRSDEDEQLRFGDLEREVLDGLEAVREPLREMFEDDLGHGCA